MVDTEKFMSNWRTSEYYPFVMKILEDAENTNFLNDFLLKCYSQGISPATEEVGTEAKVDFRVKLQIAQVKNLLK